MMHVTGVRTGSDRNKGQSWESVHLMAPGSKKLLCNRTTGPWSCMTITPEPVNCKNCWRAVQMVARNQIANLSVAGVEKILDYTALMRNGDIRDADEVDG